MHAGPQTHLRICHVIVSGSLFTFANCTARPSTLLHTSCSSSGPPPPPWGSSHPTPPALQHPNHALHPRLPPTSRIASALSSPAHLRASAPTGKPHISATQQRNYNMQTSRWKRILKAPNVASKVYTPLQILMNDVLLAEEASHRPSSQHKGIGQTRAELKKSYWYVEWWVRNVEVMRSSLDIEAQ
ncbi:hypothetical protein JB92DRAFT_3140486 [Gautieria morchelliformis]|nr:hypothetical protein JB92DRAFT_3140486 [Gautieria morchelliformis]